MLCVKAMDYIFEHEPAPKTFDELYPPGSYARVLDHASVWGDGYL